MDELIEKYEEYLKTLEGKQYSNDAERIADKSFDNFYSYLYWNYYIQYHMVSNLVSQ